MPGQRRNPFSILIGVMGVIFTLTAANYGIAVLRSVRRPTSVEATQPHPLQALMDRHGTALLAGELVVLAIATFGSVALDHAEGERIRRARLERREQGGE